jgi:hypothetical protein
MFARGRRRLVRHPFNKMEESFIVLPTPPSSLPQQNLRFHEDELPDARLLIGLRPGLQKTRAELLVSPRLKWVYPPPEFIVIPRLLCHGIQRAFRYHGTALDS